MAQAVAQSPAFKIYVCNVMTQTGETDGFKASDHLKTIVEHTNKNVINACIINNALVPLDALNRYQTECSYPVEADMEIIKEMGYKVVATDLLSVNDFVRHDSSKLTKSLIKLIETHRIVKR